MKNTILAIAFCFSTINAFAQTVFDGNWIDINSNHIITIESNEYRVDKVWNNNPLFDINVEEQLIKTKKYKLITRLFDEINRHTIKKTYTFINKNTLLCRFKNNSIDKKITYVRQPKTIINN